MVKFLKIFAILSLPFFYLLFSYVRFYHYIGYKDLESPYSKDPLVIENDQGEGSASYIALGDSLSAGVGSTKISDTFVYIYALGLLDKYKKVNLTNLAQPGGTTADVINNQLPETIEQDPEYITLLIGTNDIHNKRSVNKFYENYFYILNELLTKTHARITVLNIPYLGSSKVVYQPFGFLLNYRTKKFNETIKDVVNNIGYKERIKLIDLYDSTYLLSRYDPNYYSSDEFHPSNKGYVIWGNIINEY